MARMKRNVGDLVSGKIGNVVFYQRYGKSYVRAAPKKRESYTQEQLLYRQRLQKASALWRSLKSDEISRIWNLAAQQMNGYAWFLKANMPALEMDGTLIDPRLIKVSDGTLPEPQSLKVERDRLTLKVSWQNDPHFGTDRLSDELMMISYVEGHFSPITASGLKRGNLQGTVSLPAKPANATHVFLFMASEDGKGYSASAGLEV